MFTMKTKALIIVGVVLFFGLSYSGQAWADDFVEVSSNATSLNNEAFCGAPMEPWSIAGLVATVNLNVPKACLLEARGFDFSSIPDNANIISIGVELLGLTTTGDLSYDSVYFDAGGIQFVFAVDIPTGTVGICNTFASSVNGAYMKNPAIHVGIEAGSSSVGSCSITGGVKLIVRYTPLGTAPPAVSIPNVSDIRDTSADLEATLSAGDHVFLEGFKYGTTSGSLDKDYRICNGTFNAVSNFSATITALPPGSRIYLKAYACNSISCSESPEISFVTLPGGPPGGTPATPGEGLKAKGVKMRGIKVTR